MIQEIISLTKKFISIKSTSDNSGALEEILELALSYLKEYTIERFESNGVKSALIFNTKKRPKKFRIILYGHLDVVPGKEDQYIPQIKNNKLYGRGASDMKASTATLIMTFKEIANKVNYPLGLQLVTDEEMGGFNGTKHQVDKGVKADFVIGGDGSMLNIENKRKGVLQMKISTKGKTAHSAYLWKGKNAIWNMSYFLNQLEKEYSPPKKEIWRTTVNLANIETKNKIFNKVPDYCEIWLDIRYIPEDDPVDIISNLKRLLPKGSKLTITEKEPSLLVDENNPNITLLKTTLKEITGKEARITREHGCSNTRFFVKANCPAIELGPIGGNWHADNEWVDISSLEKYYQILKKFLMSLDNND